MRRKWLEVRLKELHDIDKGKNKSGLAKALGIPPSRVTEMLDGTRKIHSAEIPTMAKYLEWPEDTLLALISGKRGNVVRIRTRLVSAPLIDWVQAGKLTDITDPYELGDFEREIEIPYAKSSVIALTVHGSSMNRVAPEGSVIIVDYTDKDLISGKYYVIKHGGKATFKQYRSDPRRFVPCSTDPDHDDLRPNGEVEIVGRVVYVTNPL